MELFKVIRCIVKMHTPIPTQPTHVRNDAFHIFGTLCLWIGVVHTEVTASAVVQGQSKVDKTGDDMADVGRTRWVLVETV